MPSLRSGLVPWSASGFERPVVVKGSNILKVQLTIERFEGDRKQIAVLLTDDGVQINFPKNLLARDILSFEIECDLEATGQVCAVMKKEDSTSSNRGVTLPRGPLGTFG